ncbi:hypothetical protein ENSA7_08970 [Enhygromyxa salina]|uniref:DUF2267 domain-containing protein n=2 Tax=Enhygromyxa salina TaxID=215803 RepID=A0A2S9YWB1_9BACT|nr:hypothetical protein ENSA7_08970 [Enhygromyxa salina]
MGRASQAVTATFAAIGRCLDAREPLALVDVAAMLPPRFATLIREGARAGGPASFLQAVAEHERVTVGFAKEHAQVVCETFAGMLDERRLIALRERLPPEVSNLLQPAPRPVTRPPTPPSPPTGHTLANGRPGSTHPLSTAAPRAGQAHSIATSDDPHADTKLSSTKGLSPERKRETLADGKPGGGRAANSKPGPN